MDIWDKEHFRERDPQCKGPEVRACPERPTFLGMSREAGMEEVKDEKQEVKSEKEWGLDHIKPSRTVVFNGNSSLSRGNLACLETFLVVTMVGVGWVLAFMGRGQAHCSTSSDALDSPTKNHPAHNVT